MGAESAVAAIRARFLERPTQAKGISLPARLQGWLVEARLFSLMRCAMVRFETGGGAGVAAWVRRRSRTKAFEDEGDEAFGCCRCAGSREAGDPRDSHEKQDEVF